MMSNKVLAALLLLIILVLAIGFYVNDMVSSAKKISIELAGVELKSLGLEKTTLDFILNLTNPTPYKYEAESVDYEIYLEGFKVGNGTLRGIKLEPGSHSLQKATTDLYYSELSKAALSALLSGKMEFNVNGTLKLRVIIFPIELKFSESRSYP